MENEQEISSKLSGFHLTVENTRRLLLYTTSKKLKDESVTRSKVVNDALDSFFEKDDIKQLLENIA